MINQGSRRLLAASALAVVAAAAVSPSADAVTTYALTDNNFLLRFDSATPSVLTGVGPILDATNNQVQDLIGIDFRPGNGLLYAVGTGQAIYTIDPNTAQATQVATMLPDPGDVGGDPPFTVFSGSRFGLDFNPEADRQNLPSLRIISNTTQNLRVNATTGLTTTDALPAGNIIAAAYTNNDVSAATGTTLFGIDSVTDQLVQFTSPNNGTFVNVGPTGFDASSLSGFDIFFDGTNNFGFAALQDAGNGVSRFYTVDLAIGAATLVGTIEGGDFIDGLAVVPEPASLALLGVAAAAGLRRRRRV